ncbi:hypothetical protein K6V78_04875 [Streptococcus gallolyticus]|uniref:hypothetical protein n=1 Tax=Streptococcus hepaticus TaxID=3349163 RepID=UPI001C9813DE|nr:hypothetical protein [Streptococcus gallolyticus]MBY5040967.1 hypothetical protein [Streptococcus gallolyticus]
MAIQDLTVLLVPVIIWLIGWKSKDRRFSKFLYYLSWIGLFYLVVMWLFLTVITILLVNLLVSKFSLAMLGMWFFLAALCLGDGFVNVCLWRKMCLRRRKWKNS